MPWTAWLLLGVVVAWCLWAGVAFRLGHLRRLGRWYADERLPGIVRFLPLELVPIAVFLGCAGAAAAVAPEEGEDASGVGLVLFFGIFVGLGWWVWTCFRPARLLKPDWLREVDDARRAERPSGPVTYKVWENVGFACGGLAVALFLLWLGAIGSAGNGSPSVLVTAIVLAVLCVVAFVRSGRAKGRS